MSTTKIFIIFGVCVLIIIAPLMILYFGFPETLGRFSGLVENTIAGLIGALLVAILLDFTIRRRQEKANEKVARVGLSEVAVSIDRILILFGNIYKASSDEYLPSSLEELFDDKATNLLSLHLAIKEQDPTIFNTTWQAYLSRESEKILNELTETQSRYQIFLSETCLIVLSKLRANGLLRFFVTQNKTADFDQQKGVYRPVFNFVPTNNVSIFLKEILSCINTIQKETRKLNAPTILQIPSFIFRNDVAPIVGSARFEGTPGVECLLEEPVQDQPNP